MKIINSTPVSVGYAIGGNLPNHPRPITFTGKATFSIKNGKEPELESDSPLTLYNEDQNIELGLLPRDDLPKLDPTFEVMALANAYAPEGQPTTQMRVSLSVGVVRSEIDVVGDRYWQGEGQNASISSPEPFTVLPITWKRAFGGTQEIFIDAEAPVDVSYPLNGDGKGFDHVSQAQELGRTFNCPEGFPQFDPKRPLPNLEFPGERIVSWADTPLPACWAPVPLSSGLIIKRFEASDKKNGEQPIELGAPEMLHRAHPHWVIDPPPAAAEVRIEGVTREGGIGFRLPEIRVIVDLQNGSKAEQIELLPRTLVLLPEEARFYLTFRGTTNLDIENKERHVARVRVEQGWCPVKSGATL